MKGRISTGCLAALATIVLGGCGEQAEMEGGAMDADAMPGRKSRSYSASGED
jgi:hypothetical protein